ncbi:MAG: hypothetical protein DRP45_00585 [Candidatus Zixiibacteriota bacterium]|nr:MAG: hypothetical protein DRP45_00585 [candidate division Zixibacteria bacterium]
MMQRAMRVTVPSLFLLMILLVGCERTFESNDPVRSLPDRPAAPVNFQVAYNDQSVTLSWELADSTEVSRFRVYRADFVSDMTPLEYSPIDSTTTYSKVIEDLPFNRTVYLRVTAVNAANLESEPSRELPVIVGLLSIAINNNDEYTNSRNVGVHANAPNGAEYVSLSEDSLFEGTLAQDFQDELPFTLSTGDGLKTVYARFTFEDGFESGVLIFDRITLDQAARIDSVYYTPSGVTFATGDTIRFFMAAGEIAGEASIAFPGVSQVLLSDDGVGADASSDDSIYSAWYVVPVGLTVNNGQLTGQFTDAANNTAMQAVAAVPLDIKAPPLPVQLTAVTALSNFEISLQWSEATSGDFSHYSIYRDISGSVSDASDLVENISERTGTTCVDTLLDAATEYFFRVYVVDNSGLLTGSNIDSAITEVNTSPTAVTAAATLSDSTTAYLSWTQNNDNDFASYRIYHSTSPGVTITDDLIAILSDRSTVGYSDYVPFPTGSESYYYRIFVLDRQGLSTSSNEVSVSR